MFEQTLEEMSALVVIEPKIFEVLTASNVGVNPSLICRGAKTYSYSEAVDVISALDKALLSCPKYLYKRIRSQRNSFVWAFGPEMEEVCGKI